MILSERSIYEMAGYIMTKRACHGAASGGWLMIYPSNINSEHGGDVAPACCYPLCLNYYLIIKKYIHLIIY